MQLCLKKTSRRPKNKVVGFFLIEMAKVDSEMYDWDSKSLFVVVAEFSHLVIHF